MKTNYFGIETYSALEHSLIGIGIIFLFSTIFLLIGIPNFEWISYAISCSYFWGREQRDTENFYKTKGKFYFPWQYSVKSRWDFFGPVMINFLLILLFVLII